MEQKFWVGIPWKACVRALWFDESAFSELRGRASLIGAIAGVVLAVLLQAFPFGGEFHIAFLRAAVRFFGALLVVYVLIKILSSASHFEVEQFLWGVSLTCVLGLVLVWLLIGLSYMVLDWGLGWVWVRLFLVQAKAYYTILLFGFWSEVFSGLKGWKSGVIGLGGVTVFYLLYVLLGS